MADAVQVLDHRHTRVLADALDQALAAARHDHVNVFGHGDQRTHGGAIGGFHHLHDLVGQTRCRQPFTQALGDRSVGMDGLGTTTQNAGIAGLEAQTGSLDGHVRTRLIDDADHTERHAHLANLDARRQKLHVANGAHRVGKCRHLAQAFDHSGQTGRRERQTVEHRLIKAVVAAGLQVQLIGCNQTLGGRFNRLGGSQQGSILDGGRGAGNHSRGLAGLLPQLGHVYRYLFNAHAVTCPCLAKCGIIAGSPLA